MSNSLGALTADVISRLGVTVCFVCLKEDNKLLFLGVSRNKKTNTPTATPPPDELPPPIEHNPLLLIEGDPILEEYARFVDEAIGSDGKKKGVYQRNWKQEFSNPSKAGSYGSPLFARYKMFAAAPMIFREGVNVSCLTVLDTDDRRELTTPEVNYLEDMASKCAEALGG